MAEQKAHPESRFVLIIDASVDDRFVTGMLLQRFGYTICSAHTPEEAVEFMYVAPPAAVVSEGGAAGASLLDRIKQDAHFTDVPVIILESSPDPILEARARRGDIAACLRKPVDAEALFRAVQNSVERTPRQNIRITTYLKARLGDDLPGAEGYVTVLSEHGLFFRTLEPRPEQARMPVSVERTGRTITLEAQALYSSSFDEGPFKEPGMGMKFTKISDDARALIRGFILEQIEAGIVRTGA